MTVLSLTLCASLSIGGVTLMQGELAQNGVTEQSERLDQIAANNACALHTAPYRERLAALLGLNADDITARCWAVLEAAI